MRKEVPDHYKILGIQPTANEEELKKAFKQKAIETHPDKNPGKDTTAAFRAVKLAHQVLSDPRERATYDAEYRSKVVSENKSTTVSPTVFNYSPEPVRAKPYGGHEEPDYDALYKFVFVGAAHNSAKSKVINAMTYDPFASEFKSTIGIDFKTKRINHKELGQVKLQLWDTAGQERYIQITRAYFKGAKAVVIVIDVQSENSWRESCSLVERLRQSGQINDGICVGLVTIKNTLNNDNNGFLCSDEDLDQFCHKFKIQNKIEVDLSDNSNTRGATSAKLDEFLHKLVSQVSQKEDEEIKSDFLQLTCEQMAVVVEQEEEKRSGCSLQ